MKLFRKISIILILSLIIYAIITASATLSNKAYASGFIGLDEANAKMPGTADLVNNLVANHPNYTFQFYNTDIDWNTAILREYQGHGHSPTNLFNFGSNYSGMWYCPVCGTKVYDNGTLSCASREAIAYMMDPRNSITEDSVFQFKSLGIADASYDDIARACIGTFLNNGECVGAIFEASQAYNINAFYLVAKILTEHGSNGTTLSNGVVVNGATVYNLFNIGAYGNGSEIIANGANYAASQNWFSRRDAILGGAQSVKDNYIGKGQDTCYYQKYNVVNASNLFQHQYAQNILAAENEGRKFKSYYNVDGSITGQHVFVIPVFNNMPSSCPRPDPTVTNSISYETGVITANGGVKLRIGEGTGAQQISSISQNTGVKILARGNNNVDGHYWDLVISDEKGDYGYVARTYISTTGSGSSSGSTSSSPSESQPTPSTPPATQTEGQRLVVSGSSLQISSSFTLDDLKAQYPYVVIQDNTGAVTARLCTGYTVSINGGSYVLVKKGDVNGDGDIDVSDVVATLNHIKRTSVINDSAKLEAARLSGESEISVTDVVRELNFIKGSLNDILVK